MERGESDFDRELVELAILSGAEPGYFDIDGHWHELIPSTALRLLQSLNIGVGSLDELRASRADLVQQQWRKVLPAALVKNSNAENLPIEINLSESLFEAQVHWVILCEGGGELVGEFRPDYFNVIKECRIGDELYRRFNIILKVQLEPGYHQLEIRFKSGQRVNSQLIAVPEKAFLPCDERLWGLSTQLYALAGGSNWGLGDFGDLRELVLETSRLGGHVVGLNPLHCPQLHPGPCSEETLSPYSPTSRAGLNLLYIEIPEVPEFSQLELSSEESKALETTTIQLRESTLIDYEKVLLLKLQFLEKLARMFYSLEGSDARMKQFQEFRRVEGSRFSQLALFQALQEHFCSLDKSVWGFHLWPEEYQRPDTSAVKEFRRTHEDRVKFYEYVEWLAHSQLSSIKMLTESRGMKVGLYLDLALGSADGGADVWINPGLFAKGVNLGAPPDQLGPKGQDWGLPPMIPDKLVELGYQPFITALKFNMRYAGALRIDHIMQVMRLFWIPQGMPASAGAYMRYPLDELIGIIALESQRNQTVVVGEDLGTVPDQVRDSMSRRGILSYKVLYFMKGHDGRFLSPKDYPHDSLVVTSTHDLPTLSGYWEAQDLRTCQSLNLFPSEEISNRLFDLRNTDIAELINALRDSGLWSEQGVPQVMNSNLISAIHKFLAKTPALLQIVQLEDLLGVKEQTNLPGTVHEHANWRRKLPLDVRAISQQDGILACLRGVDNLRKALLVN